jgi:hypothetical protein
MSQHESDKDDPAPKVDLRDQSHLVASDVENDANSHEISMGIIFPNVRQIPPFGLAGDFVPALQSLLRIRVFVPELRKRPLADNSHRHVF